MRICVLGPLQAYDRGLELDLGPARQRALLGLLVAADGRSIGVDGLVDELWGESAPPKVMASLQVHVANLRRILEPDRAPRSRPTRLVTRPPGYALLGDGLEIDAVTFAAEVAEGRRLLTTDPAAAVVVLERALDRWTGEAYAGLIDGNDTLAAEAARLDELRLGAAEDLAHARLDLGRHAEVVADLEPLVRQNPLRERAWGLLTRALYRAQRQGDALEALRRARTHLADELGVDPSPELRELEAAVLAQDPALAAPAPPVAVATAPPAGGLTPRGPIGRAEALAAFTAAVADARSGRGRIVVVTGEPGIGKSVVARAGIERARAEGALTGWGSWDEEGGARALQPWSEAIAVLLEQRSGSPLDGRADPLAPLAATTRGRPDPTEDADVESAAFRLAGALADLVGEVGAGRTVVLVLDDLHWADADSLRLLRRFAPAVAGLPLVLVLTSRTAEAELSDDVVATAATIARHDPVRIPLRGLSAADVEALLTDRAGVPPAPGLVQAVLDRTDGNPFYIGEVLRLVGSDEVSAVAVSGLDVPDGVRDVVRRRLTALTDAAREVLAVGSVAGRRLAVDVVEDVVALGQDEVDAAFDLALLHDLLVADDEPGSLRFAHALVREAIYAQVPAHRRMRLHAKVAQGLERLRMGTVDSHLSELVLHFRLAGPAYARACWTYAVRAGRAAVVRGAYEEAAHQYGIALDAMRTDPQSTTADEIGVLAGLGRVRRRQADVTEAWRLLSRAARLMLDRGDPVGAATVAFAIADGTLWTWRDYGEVDREAIALWRRLLDAIPPGNGGVRARVMGALAMELFHDPEEVARSAQLAEESVLLARAEGTDEDLLRILQLAHIVLERPDRFDRRIALGEEQVAVATRLGRDLSHALCQRGTDRFEAGRLAEAEADLRRAHELGVQNHEVSVQLVAGWALAVILPARGQLAAAAARIGELDDVQQMVTMVGREIAAGQRVILAGWAGTLGDLEPVLAEASAQNPGFRDPYLLSVLAAHGADRARGLAGRWTDQPPIPFDYIWLVLTMLRARLWAALGDRDAVGDLRAALRPYAGRWAIGGGSAAFDGIVDEALAVLAVAAGDADEAQQCSAAAVDAYESRELWAMLARACRTRAAALRLRDPSDPAAAAADSRADVLAATHGIAV